MGQADVNVNLWLKDTKRFADLFNAILFQGKAVILPENLHPSPETTAVSLQDAQGKNVVKKQYRDIIMNWQDQAVLMLLAVESQTAIHYAAPLKVMLYDSMEYAEQVRVKWKERPPRLSSAEFLSRFQKNEIKDSKAYECVRFICCHGFEWCYNHSAGHSKRCGK